MFSFKAVHTTFHPTKHTFFHTKRPNNKKGCILRLCKSNDSNSEANPQEGDAQKQELLARIAMLQAQKVRLTDYLDERSTYLNQFGEEANAEFDKIGEEALKGLDEASSRIMENIESRMQAFEETSRENRMEIEKNDNKLADLEGQIEMDRNEGMFFKSLGKRAPVDKVKAKEEAQKIKDLANAKAGSKVRKNIYLALMFLLVIVIADAFISSSPDWRKVAILGAILVGLIVQYSYEQRLSSDLNFVDALKKKFISTKLKVLNNEDNFKLQWP